MGQEPTVLSRWKDPAYTGDNRCGPCTVLNATIAGGLGVVGWVLASPPVGLAVVAVSALVIYLRGYLVPGTPTLTKRYFPRWLLARFGKAEPVQPVEGDVDVEDLLTRHGVLEECRDGDDLCLSASFERPWKERLDERTVDRTQRRTADLFGVDPESLTTEHVGNGVVVREDDEEVARWESRAAYVADVSAAGLLAERLPEWPRLSAAVRGELLAGVRIFLDRCPVCSGDLRFGDELVESCCTQRRVVALTCPECESRLLEVDQAAL